MTNDRKQRAARAEEMRKEREKAERRQRNTISIAIVAVVLVLIAAGGWAVKSAADKNETVTEVIEPRNLTNGGVAYPTPTGVDASEAPVLETFEDFLCPACGQFEQLSGEFLRAQAEAGSIQLIFQPFSFLDAQSTNEYSSRAMNLAMCAIDEQGEEAFWKIKAALFANQPDEGGAGPTNSELITTAEDAGVSGLDECQRTEKFVPWIQEARDKAAKDRDVGATPTVFIDDKVSEARTPDELQEAITAASKS